MKRRLAAIAVLSLLASFATPRLRAAGPQFWRIEGAAAFLEGDIHGLSVDSEGRVRLGGAPRPIYDPVAPNAWSVARGASGALYLGTGNDGRVMRFEGGSGSLLFDSDELEVHAVAVSPDGKVYAGTSPDGAVYAIDPNGKTSRFFDPKEKYIWALAFDAKGNLYVATGAEARVYRVDRDGKASVVLSSTDTHLMSLALDARGALYAGSAPGGLVYRVDAAGRVSVVLDSPFREIHALAVSPDGGLYAAAVDASSTDGTPRPAAAAAAAPAAGVTVVPEVTVTESFTVLSAPGVALGAPAADLGTPGPPPKGAVLWISDGGNVETLWTSQEDVPYSLLLTQGGVLVGTGGKGKLYRVTRSHDWTLSATVPAEQVTALAAGAGKDAIVVTSNPARVFALDGTLASEGTFVSKVKDATTAARWGRITWEGKTVADSAVRVQTRAGNTEHPDSTWSDWSAPATHATGEAIADGLARFLQVRLTLVGKGGATPSVEAIAASYLQRNLAPEVKAITVHPPGEVFQKPISVSGDPEILGFDPDPLAVRAPAGRAAGTASAAVPAAVTFSRKMFQRGMRTLSWQADDANGDALLYDVQYRAVGDERWRPLRRGLTEAVLAWDTSTVPNGRYVVRVIASDAPGNPPNLALSGSKDSASFEVDNTPPTILAALERQRIRATVRDDSPLRELEISVDAGRWEEVYPVDGVADSPEEQYDIAPRVAGSGPHVVMLRATDILGNTSTVRVDVP
jgi:outer membrane protein assembly factor BamB